MTSAFDLAVATLRAVAYLLGTDPLIYFTALGILIVVLSLLRRYIFCVRR